MDELINANELIAAGIAFSITDIDVPFLDNGELAGVTHDLDGYETIDAETQEWIECQEMFAHDDYVNTVDLGVTANSLEIDRDSFLDGQEDNVKSQLRACVAVASNKRPHGEMQAHAQWRRERFHRLCMFAIRAKSVKTLKALQQGAYNRFSLAMGRCIARAKASKADWSDLYLTKDQMSELAKVCQDCIRALR